MFKRICTLLAFAHISVAVSGDALSAISAIRDLSVEAKGKPMCTVITRLEDVLKFVEKEVHCDPSVITLLEDVLKFVEKEAHCDPSPTPTPGPSEHEVDLVQTSWSMVEAALSYEQVGVILYQNIFKVWPELLQLFPFRDIPIKDLYDSDPMKHQGHATVTAVATAVKYLKTLDEVVPTLKKLGTHHAGRGIVRAHYDVVGEALLDTLAAGLGGAWNDELKTAWAKVYKLVSDTMYAAQQVAEPDGNHGHWCSVCGHEYYALEDANGTAFEALPDDWKCPICAAPKSEFTDSLRV
jgi:hemoglobin-like flavoprotein/rubredoxin